MKQIIKDVLRRYEDSQQNLSSESARNLIASEIEAVLGHKGTYHEYTDSEVEEQKDRESWVCSICGKSTYDVDWDYLGSGTNHLGCELELEMKDDKRVTKDRREKNWAQKKHEEKVFAETHSQFVTDDVVEKHKRGPDRRKSDRREGVQTLDGGGGITFKETEHVAGFVSDTHSQFVTDDVNLNERINQHHELYQKLGPPTNGLESGSPEDYGEKPFIYVRDKNKVKTRRMTDEEYGYYKNRKFYTESYAMDSNSYDAGVDPKDYDSIQKQAYNEMSSDGLPPGGDAQAVRESHRLAEEIVDTTDKKYIYESPDGGKTIYRRGLGEDKRELVKDWPAEKKRIEDNWKKERKVKK